MKSNVLAPDGPIASQGIPSSIVTATADSLPEQPHALTRARAFAEPLIASETMDTGENILAHADAVVSILKSIGGSEAMQAATYLVHSCQHLNKPQEVIAKAFGASYAALAVETTKLIYVQRQTRTADPNAQLLGDPAAQTVTVRKMLLAFSRD
ncbi:MAG: HD domain-containing protein, partial [Polaromonas sp.]